MIIFVIFLFLTLLPSDGYTEYIYRSMWPTYEHPWYFYNPTGIETDHEGYVYIVNKNNDYIQKYTEDGFFVTQWGGQGSGDGQFIDPFDIAIDDDGFLYITDMNNHRVQKFAPEGLFVKTWGKRGTGDNEFDKPHGIAIDSKNFLYVVDTSNNRIKKYTSDGIFVSSITGQGNSFSEFKNPEGIAIDNEDFVYISDTDNHRVVRIRPDGNIIEQWGKQENQSIILSFPHALAIHPEGYLYLTEKFNDKILKFNIDGNFIQSWGRSGNMDEEFNKPYGLALDPNGNLIYVVDTNNHRIQKFSSDGNFITRWGGSGEGGNFNKPKSIFLDGNRFIFVVDTGNHRVQKFNMDGEFIEFWGERGTGEGQFIEPYDIVIDSKGIVYVSDTFNHRIQRLSSDGEFIGYWKAEEDDNNLSFLPLGMAIDDKDNLYVVDQFEKSIIQFSSDGEVLRQWKNGDGNYSFESPYDIAIDSNDTFYIVDSLRNSVLKFTSGEFVEEWEDITPDINLYLPYGIAVDTVGDEDFIYIADSGNHRIVKTNTAGEFIESFGEAGHYPGQMQYPSDISILEDKFVFVADTDNHRIQIFQKQYNPPNEKAILVAGGGPYPGNHLWDATRANANFAYRTLYQQGFDKKTITFLSADTETDLDGNNLPDDIDAPPSIDALREAITQWADDADSLVLYFVDHGGTDTFRLNSEETFSSSDLNNWLDQYQDDASKNATLILDACSSGSFTPHLLRENDANRLVIASTAPEENAYFLSQGSLSFSGLFWSDIFIGKSVGEAFDQAKTILGALDLQSPLLKGTEDLIPEEMRIGSGNHSDLQGSTISDVTIGTTDNVIEISTSVESSDNTSRVWAAILLPDYRQDNPDIPIIELPAIELMPAGENRYAGEYQTATLDGDYRIAIYIKDSFGNTTDSKVISRNIAPSVTSKALILQSHPPSSPFSPSVTLADHALRFQGYGDKDIHHLGSSGMATESDLENLIRSIASSRIKDLILYFTGTGSEKGFQLYPDDYLSPHVLQNWLTEIRQQIDGKIIFICDADYAGRFLPHLKGEDRVLIASTGPDQERFHPENSNLTFSGFFWKDIYNGIDLRNAFSNAKRSIQYMSDKTALLDDNGNGIGNENSDGRNTINHRIGAGIRLVNNSPIIVSSSPDITLTGEKSLPLWADQISAVREIREVSATIAHPEQNNDASGGKISTIPLLPNREGRYEGVYSGFESFGFYKVNFYAADEKESLSLLKSMTVYQSEGLDLYEPDDTRNTASIITINNEKPQFHSIHTSGDEDWLIFYALSGRTYSITAVNPGGECPLLLEILPHMGSLIESEVLMPPENDSESWDWRCEKDGIYFIRISDAESLSRTIGYGIKISLPIGPLSGYIKGSIRDRITGDPVSEASVVTNADGSCISFPGGNYIMNHEPGNFVVAVSADGYETATSRITIGDGGIAVRDFFLDPADTDGDGYPDQQDAFPNNGGEWSDADADGAGDNSDQCPHDPMKVLPGQCGCGISDNDSDRDGTADCSDGCISDPQKTDPGICGCRNADTDDNRNGIIDCLEEKEDAGDPDECPEDPFKTAPGRCGCGVPDTDSDLDGSPDCLDECPDDPDKISKGICGCGNIDGDENGNGIIDCQEETPHNSAPVPETPLDGRMLDLLTPELEILPHESQASHNRTQWQISPVQDFSYLQFDLTTESYRYHLKVPDLILIPGRQYFWRARFYSTTDEPTPWSFVRTFSISSDASDNGDDCIESIDSNINICFFVDRGTDSILSAKRIDFDGQWFDIPAYFETPLGIFTFRTGLSDGDGEASVDIRFSRPLPGNAKLSCYDYHQGWYQQYPGSSIENDTVTAVVKDGSAGDIDGTANGYVVMICGIETSESVSQEPLEYSSKGEAGGFGCFIDSSYR